MMYELMLNLPTFEWQYYCPFSFLPPSIKKKEKGKGREREHFLEIFKLQVYGIILPKVSDWFLYIGWVPMS